MNLLKSISNEDPIGGLEIEDGAIRFALLKKERTGLKAIHLMEERLSEKEDIDNDILLTDKITKLAKKNKIKYVIISVPSNNIFIKTYNFPAIMPDNKITESMDLVLDLQLPKKKQEIYCDWMQIEKNETDKKIALSYIIKSRADKLLAAIKKTGLKVVAIESRIMSFSRILKQTKDEALLVIEKGKNMSSLAVVMNNNAIFSQSIPNNKLNDNLSKEAQKIINYYDWLNITIRNTILIGDFKDQKIKKLPLKIVEVETISKINGLEKDLKWFIALGAAMRGLIPRKDDQIISLMNIGTEKAYKQEKINSTTNFLISLNAALAIFFFAAFMATWSLISIIQNNYIKQISSFYILPSSENSMILNEKVADFNSLIDQMSVIVQKEPLWSKVIEETKNKVVVGISINNIALSSIDGLLSITGIAINREAINALKQSFESSEIFGEVAIPLDNLGKKVDIPFSMTFRIKSPELIYNK